MKKIKNMIVAFLLVFATSLIADSQTGAAVGAGNLNTVPAVEDLEIDEIPMGDEPEGQVEMAVKGEGADQLVDIRLEKASISEVLQAFRQSVKANIVSTESTNMSRRVSMALYGQPWLKALRTIVERGRFIVVEQDGIYSIEDEQTENPVVRTRSFELNHASADDLAKLLNESFCERDKRTGKPVGTVASVFKDANVVVVQGTDKQIRDYEDVIKTVDKAPEQVYIEARFIELSSAAMHKLGIDWRSLEKYSVNLKDVKFGVERNFGRLGNYGYAQPNNTDQETRSEDEGGTAARGRTAMSMVPDAIPESIALLDTVGGTEQARSMQWKQAQAFSGQLSADNFSLALSAFEQMSDVKMFSNPRIIVSNGKQAQVDMTTKYPNVRVTSNRTGGISDSLDITAQLEQIPGEEGALFAKEVFFSWGISMLVTPRISPDGLINVEIVPSISDCTEFAEVQGGEGSAYSKYPIIQMQRLVTDFTMKDGSTAVIGGLTRTSEEDVDTGIPYLRKIPWIGQKLFGWKGRSKVQKEIIVFVTVGIANPKSLKQDVGLPKNAVLGREYVEGRALEPGDRGGVDKTMKLDMRDVDSRIQEDAKKMTAEPVKADPVKAEPVKAEPEEEEVESAEGELDQAAVVQPVGPEKREETPVGPAKVQRIEPVDEGSAGPQKKEFVFEEEDEPQPVRKIRHGRAK